MERMLVQPTHIGDLDILDPVYRNGTLLVSRAEDDSINFQCGVVVEDCCTAFDARQLRGRTHLNSSINDVVYEIVVFLEGTEAARFTGPFVNQPIVIIQILCISELPFECVEILSLVYRHPMKQSRGVYVSGAPVRPVVSFDYFGKAPHTECAARGYIRNL